MIMPNPYIDNATRWLDLSEVDYLGHFVKAWLAFNAWYRSAYTHTADRAIIDELKWQHNVVSSKLVPLLTKSSQEAEQFRSNIGILHHRLENYGIYTGKGAEKKRITFKNVYLKKNNSITAKNENKYRMNYLVVPDTVKNPMPITCKVINSGGIQVFHLIQTKYDPTELENSADFTNRLNAMQQGYLKALYQKMNPILTVDLTNYATDHRQVPIQAGTYQFRCTQEELFAGVCEIIYQMRNTLFHGELVPSREATACYEPAYNIVRKFLMCIS